MQRIIQVLMVLCLAAVAVAQDSANRRQVPNSKQLVHITNITAHELFSPALVIAHDRSFEAFTLGAAASSALETLAESGDPSAMAEYAASSDAVTAVATAGGLLQPGQTTVVEIDAAPGDRITVLSMLVHTNDGFLSTTFPAVGTPNFKTASQALGMSTYMAHVYDAGTEQNTESCADVPGCGGSESPVDEVGFVHAHRGIHNVGDIIASNYDFRGPVASVKVKRAASDYQTLVRPFKRHPGPPGTVTVASPVDCEGAGGTITVSWSESEDTWAIEAWLDGLPQTESYSWENDPSTPYNQIPQTITDGRWQMWLSYGTAHRTANWVYDADGNFLGHEAAFDTLPDGAQVVENRINHNLCFNYFKVTPDGKAHLRFEGKASEMLDMLGTAGNFVGPLATNLNEPDNRTVIYTEGGLPTSYALSWMDVVNEVGQGIALVSFALSLESNPKEDYLRSRDSLLYNPWSGHWPEAYEPPELGADVCEPINTKK